MLSSRLGRTALSVVEPRRTVEVWTYLLSMTLGATMYAVFVASLTSAISDGNASGRAYQSKLDMARSYMAVSVAAMLP